MVTCVENLREIEAKTGWSRYRIAKEVGLSSARMYQLFDQGGTYDDRTALAVAKILDKDPAVLITSAHAEREKNPEVKATWEALLEKISKGFKDFISGSSPRQLMI
jgi:transcriptional regulator with XRE-family HTH domain